MSAHRPRPPHLQGLSEIGVRASDAARACQRVYDDDGGLAGFASYRGIYTAADTATGSGCRLTVWRSERETADGRSRWIVAFRGTRLEAFSDILCDVGILASLVSEHRLQELHRRQLRRRKDLRLPETPPGPGPGPGQQRPEGAGTGAVAVAVALEAAVAEAEAEAEGGDDHAAWSALAQHASRFMQAHQPTDQAATEEERRALQWLAQCTGLMKRTSYGVFGGVGGGMGGLLVGAVTCSPVGAVVGAALFAGAFSYAGSVDRIYRRGRETLARACMFAAEEVRRLLASQIPIEELSSVVLCGHSLGGWLAEVVALLTGLPCCTFGAPGSARYYVENHLLSPDNSGGHASEEAAAASAAAALFLREVDPRRLHHWSRRDDLIGAFGTHVGSRHWLPGSAAATAAGSPTATGAPTAPPPTPSASAATAYAVAMVAAHALTRGRRGRRRRQQRQQHGGVEWADRWLKAHRIAGWAEELDAYYSAGTGLGEGATVGAGASRCGDGGDASDQKEKAPDLGD